MKVRSILVHLGAVTTKRRASESPFPEHQSRLILHAFEESLPYSQTALYSRDEIVDKDRPGIKTKCASCITYSFSRFRKMPGVSPSPHHLIPRPMF